MATLLSLVFLIAVTAADQMLPSLPNFNDTEHLIRRVFDGAPEGRVVNGIPSKLFDRPYQVSIQVPINGQWVHYCGGVIIDTDRILTAGHCINNIYLSYPHRVEVGSLSLQAPPLPYTQIIEVSSMLAHEGFVMDPYRLFPNDIGVVYLKDHIRYNENVQPLKLAPPGQTFDNQECIVSGWGNMYFQGPVPTTLLEAPMRKWTYQQCFDFHSQVVGIPSDANHICIIGEGEPDNVPSVCNGDSGGPLMCQRKGRKYLVGVTSYNFQCLTQYPSIYTRVSGYNDWINKHRYYYDDDEL